MAQNDYPGMQHDEARHHKTPVQWFALLMGLGFLAAGVLGFIPGATVMHETMHHDMVATASQGNLFGVFPVNWLHNLVHLLFGAWGVFAFASFAGSRVFARSTAIIYAVFAIMGLIPVLASTFGLVPLWGNDIWLHAGIAVVAAVFGWGTVAGTEREYGHGHTPHHA